MDTDALSTFRTQDPACRQEQTADGDPLPGWIAAEWIAQDVAAAEADPETDLIFAMGHKPIQVSGSSDPQGRETILNCANAQCGAASCKPTLLADRFLSTLAGSSKAVGYLTSHVHDWQHASLGSDNVPQIIAGNAGSPPFGADSFGFTLVTVHRSGKVVATSYGRSIPDPIDDPAGVEPATARNTVVLKDP